MGEITS